MKNVVKIGLGAMIKIPSFMNFGPFIKNLMKRIHGHRQHGDRMSALLFFK
jgi:hypothetical protein